MFGGSAFSEDAFSTFEHVPLDSTAFSTFLDEPGSKRCLLLEIDALSLASTGASSGGFSDGAFSEMGFGEDSAGVTGGVVTLTWSSGGFISQATDTPASVWYDARIKTDNLLIERAIIGRDGVGGLSAVVAQISLINMDGALDTLQDDYALDGRACRILVGRETDPRASFGTLFAGVVRSISTAAQGTTPAASLRLSLSDGLARLDVPVQTTRYLGTGGTEGGADLKGKPKPRAFGKVFNVTPPLVDSANLIYQVNSGAINDVPAVRDRGVALTKVAGAPAGGQYQVDAANGTFKLGATPAGTVTCDVEGDAVGGYITTAPDMVLRLLAGTLTTSDMDTTSFVNLKTLASAPVGIYVGAQEETLAHVVDELLASVGAFGGFSRQGVFAVGLVAAADGAPLTAFDESDIKGIEREPLPGSLDPLVWQVQVGYQKNYTVQSDIAAGAAAADRTFAAQPYRISTRSDSAVKSRRLLAREYAVSALFRDSADADAEAQRLYDLWGINRAPLRIKLPTRALVCDVGSVVTITHRRHRLSLGKAARVIGYKCSWPDVELRVIP